MQRNSFVFYRSFYEGIKELPDEVRLQLYDVICDYSLNTTEPQLTGTAKGMFTLIRPLIDSNNEKYQNGCKGGRPPKGTKETKAKPKHNQSGTTPKPNVDEDVDADANLDDNGEIDKSLSLEERENIFGVFFFVHRLKSVKGELERFINHYSRTSWLDKNGVVITDKIAAAKNWEPRKGLTRHSEKFTEVYEQLYRELKRSKSGTHSLLLTDFHGYELSENRLTLKVSQNLRELLEANVGHLKKWKSNGFLLPTASLQYQIPN